MSKYSHPGGGVAIDAESLAGKRFPYQEDRSLVEDIEMLEEDGQSAVFDRYTNAFIKIYFDIPKGREDEMARKVLMKHLISGNSYGIQLKAKHAKFPQPTLGPWVDGSETVGTDYRAPVLEGWERPAGH